MLSEPERFQLILFDLIGKVQIELDILRGALKKSFQLILFDLIGKGPNWGRDPEINQLSFPTNPIWPNR